MNKRRRGLLDPGDFYGQVLTGMWYGARLICPVCHQGRIFRSRMHINERCPHCGIVFEPEPGTFSGALMLAMGITGLVVALGAILLQWAFDLSAEFQIYLWAAFTCLFLPFAYTNFKGAWLGFMHTLRRMK